MCPMQMISTTFYFDAVEWRRLPEPENMDVYADSWNRGTTYGSQPITNTAA